MNRWLRLLVVIGVLGFVARLAVAILTYGSNDMDTWTRFAVLIRQHGTLWLYEHDHEFNHPPLPGYLAAIMNWLSTVISVRFSICFKLPLIGFEIASAVVLWRIWYKRGGERAAALSLLAFGWGLDGILVSSYHGNTDCIYAFFCLLSAYLIEEKGADFVGGLALGAAINVKLIPVLLIAPYLGRYRDWRKAARFIGGLAVAAIPYIPVLIVQGRRFYENAIVYNSVLDAWGINMFLLDLRWTRLAPEGSEATNIYRMAGRDLILLSVALLGVLATRTDRWNRYQLGAMTMGLFLVLTPGFGVQYTVGVVPLLFAASLPVGALYSTLAGLFIGLVYFFFWTGSSVPASNFHGAFAPPAALFGLLAWWTLVCFIARTLYRRPKTTSTT
jgi:Glycosyltransferase family 87